MLRTSILAFGTGASGLILGSFLRSNKTNSSEPQKRRSTTLSSRPDAKALEFTRKSRYLTASTQSIYPGFVDYLIVGGGVAASSAAKVLRALSVGNEIVQKRILMISEESSLPYNRIHLSKKPAWLRTDPEPIPEIFAEDGKSTLSRLQDFGQNERPLLSILTNHQVVGINSKMNYATIRDGESGSLHKIAFSKCLLAPGCSAKQAEFVNEHRIFAIPQTIDQFEQLREKIYESRGNILLVGNDFASIELATAIRQFNESVKVYVLCPNRGLLPKLLPERMSQQIARSLEKVGVKVVASASLDSVDPTDKDVSLKIKYKISGSDGIKKLNADFVIIDSAWIANTDKIDFAESSVETNSSGHLVADALLQCSPDIFAAGSSMSFFDVLSRSRRINYQYDHALMSGRSAAFNMFASETNKPMKPFCSDSVFWCDITDELSIEGIGETNCEKHKTKSLFVMNENLRNGPFKQGIIAYLDSNNKIVGILLWNFIGKIGRVKDFLRTEFEDSNQLENILKQLAAKDESTKTAKKGDEENLVDMLS